jgi:hypothetical protein
MQELKAPRQRRFRSMPGGRASPLRGFRYRGFGQQSRWRGQQRSDIAGGLPSWDRTRAYKGKVGAFPIGVRVMGGESLIVETVGIDPRALAGGPEERVTFNDRPVRADRSGPQLA